MASKQSTPDLGVRKVWGILLLSLCLFIALSVFSYDWKDISLLQVPPNTPPCNLIGPVGAWFSFCLLMTIGIGAFLVPAWCLVFGMILVLDREDRVWPRAVWLSVVTLALTALMELKESTWEALRVSLNIVDTGGIFGRLITRGLLIRWLSEVGSGILIGTVLVVGLVLLIEVGNFVRAFQWLVSVVGQGLGNLRAVSRERQGRQRLLEREQRQVEKQRRKLERAMQKDEKRAAAKARAEERARRVTEEAEAVPPAPVPRAEPRPPPKATPPAPPAATEIAVPSDAPPYELPPLSLLSPTPAGAPALKIDTQTTSNILVETLSEFGIEVQVTHVETGPVVTRYQLLPAAGVRIERITALSNNLALALKATSVRVQAPIPGKGVVGIEVPNSVAKMVYLREVLESEQWQAGNLKVPLVLGKDVGGKVMVADLADMPHLLIAGATGAGKTVCMNTILAGLLMAKRPDELRLMLVDPKIVEFSVYNHLPHLVVPVITDPQKVTLGLRWAINEMEKRYKLFARVGVRNIDSYNNREILTQEELFESGEQDRAADPRTIPYIVVIIDELADLMLAAQADIENSVARLAQLSRAVGIHMILSTQRPSVNVITGTIKANFPARMAFQVAQKVDSRTILDTVGADKLLGRGDMLFLPPGTSRLVRAQGAMTRDEETREIVKFITNQAQPAYEREIKEKLEKVGKGGGGGDAYGEEEDDEMLNQAVEIIRETRRASTSSLQRRLRIGYTRAARVMDILEEKGLIGPPRGSEPREILIDLDGEIPENQVDDEEFGEEVIDHGTG